MQLIVNHLTRMQAGCLCVAGIEESCGLHIRPIEQRQLKTSRLRVHGGPLFLGAKLEFPKSRFAGSLPEIEDRLVNFAECRSLAPVDRQALVEHCEVLAADSLQTIFGDELRRLGERALVVPEHRGLRSLGCWRTRESQLLVDPSNGRLRIQLSIDDSTIHVPITDIRLFLDDHVTPDMVKVQRVNPQLLEQPRQLLCVGLSRPFRRKSSEPAYHWFQVNNIITPWID